MSQVANVNTTTGQVEEFVEDYAPVDVAPPKTLLSTIDPADFDDAVFVIQTVDDATPISEHLDKIIELKDVIAQRVPINKKDAAGNIVGVDSTILVILVGSDGKSYRALSPNLYRSVSALIENLGSPSTWPHPLNVKVVQGRSGDRIFYNLRIVNPAAKTK